MEWVMEDPDSVSYLLHCREPEVAGRTDAQAGEQNARLFGRVMDWLVACDDPETMRSVGPQVFFSLWLGPLEMYARLWLDGERDRVAMRAAMDELSDGLVRAMCEPARSSSSGI
jgi:hypothetical protein